MTRKMDNMIWKIGVLLLFCSVSVLGDDPTVKIESTDPPIDELEGVIVQHKNRDVQLTCVVENKPDDSEVQWVVENVKKNLSAVQISSATRSNDAFRWAIDNPSSTAWRLRIQNAQVADEGEYTCRVQVVTQGYVKRKETLKIVQVPQISDLDTSNDIIESAGKPGLLECYATGRPEPVIKWRRLAGELLPSGGKELFSNVLRIDQLRASHSGMYICTATNSAGSDSRSIKVTVKFRPEVRSSGKVKNTVRQKVGYGKSLVCNVKGYPQPTPEQISWTREQLPIRSNDRYRIRIIPGAANKITSILTISRVRSSDFGRFGCSATNEKGTEVAYIDLVSSPVATEEGFHHMAGASSLIFSLAVTVFFTFTALLVQWL